MSYYHMRIKYKSGTEFLFAYEVNLFDLQVVEIKNQWDKGESMFFDGRTIFPKRVNILKIYRTNNKIRYNSQYWHRTYPEGYYGDFGGIDATRDFIKKPPTIPLTKEKRAVPLSKNVFIVHGRDHKPMKELQTMLIEFGLTPIVLHEQASGSRTIVEKLEKYSDVGYAFVILTPDDVGYNQEEVESLFSGLGKHKHPKLNDIRNIILEENIGTIGEISAELFSLFKERARQNVVLEFGLFMGKIGRDMVCCLYKGKTELPSDMHGIVYIPFKDSVNECHNKIVKELKEVGYEL